MSRILNVGIIGVGGMGSKHAKIYSQLPQTNISAIADPDKDRCEKASIEHNIKNIYSDYKKMISESDLDIIDICTPDEYHFEPYMDAINADKHIFMEKPLSTDLKEAEKMVKVSKNVSQKIMIGFLLRYDPRYYEVKRALKENKLGEIIYIVSHRNSPITEGPVRYKKGTSLTKHVAVHDLDLINWFIKSEALEVSATSTDKMLSKKDMHDAITAILKFENDTIASVNYSWVLPENSPTLLDARMEIVGTKGSVHIGEYNNQNLFFTTLDDGSNAPDLFVSPVLNNNITGALREEIVSFVEAIKQDKPTPISPEEAFVSVKWAELIEKSLDDHEVIKL